ncbi:MAG: hypothetical protein ACXAEF_06915 [Candidatus Thorarchaeota archaeon]|jgi:hypothetical protein
MNSEDEDIQVTFNPEAAKLLCFKTILLMVVVFLPLLFIYWFQELLTPWFGDPSPQSPVYLSIVALLIGWYVFGLGIFLPWAGRRIDVVTENKAQRNNDSELDD